MYVNMCTRRISLLGVSKKLNKIARMYSSVSTNPAACRPSAANSARCLRGAA